MIDDKTGYVTERLAVDLPGEDEELRALLPLAEELQRRLRRAMRRRHVLERSARAEHDGGALWDSLRMQQVSVAVDYADRAERLITSALCSSGTMTDEILL